VIDERDLHRLIEGECSPAEAAAIQAWVAADPKRGRLLEELRAVWRLTGSGTRRWDVAAARRRLLRAYNTPSRSTPADRQPTAEAQRPSRQTAIVWTRRFAVASCVVAIAVTIAARMQRVVESAREYVTTPGQRATVSLVDGTRVLLSVDSKLRVLAGYGAGKRVVELEGEAYFVVRHDDESPFMVRTRRGVARDLGTEFAVRAYRHEPYLQVVVATDSVELLGAELLGGAAREHVRSLMLRPRDRGVIDADGRATIVSGVSLDQYVAWTRGRLVFDDASVTDVVAQLRRWYDLDIQLDDASLGAERITITFDTDSGEEALSALAKVLNVGLTRIGRSVRLAPWSSVSPQQ
jgi:transmembrane sensor